MERVLTKIYSNPREVSGFSNVNKLLTAAREKNKSITRNQVQDFLRSQDSYTLFRNRRVRYPTTKTRAALPDHHWQIDLSSLTHLSDDNDGTKYLFFCIDVYSRYLWIRPLRSKSSKDTANAILSIFDQGRVPGLISSDSGTEFKDKFKEVLKAYSIGYFTLHGASKASIVERVQRTLKSKIFRYLYHNNTKRYLDVLPHFVHAYNSTSHRVIGTTPIHKSLCNIPGIAILPNEKKNKIKFRYSIGDYVRVSRVSSQFSKAFEGTFNSEIFVVHRKHHRSGIKVYQLKDLNNEIIEGIFYEEELQKINYNADADFKIEKILHKKKIHGKYYYKVKWSGYPSSFNSYVLVENIRKPT